MYVLNTYPFNKEGIEELKKLEPFPSVYIIENGSEIYIGETVHPANRLKDHLRDKKVARPANMHIISNFDFYMLPSMSLRSWGGSE